MASLDIPDLNLNPTGWGPAEDDLPEKFKHLPYQPFCKRDQIGRVSDWTGASDGRIRWGRHWNSGMPSHPNMFEVGEGFKIDASEKGDFSLVNTEAKPMRVFQKWGNRFNDRNGNNKIAQTQEYQNNKQNNTIRRRDNFKNKRFPNRRGHFNKNVPREHSVKVDPTWKQIEHYQLPNLQKKFMKQPEGTDVKIIGEARNYDKNYDTVNRNNKKVNPELIDRLDFQYPTTLKDKTLKECLKEHTMKKALVLGTDNIISTLMCMGRSVIPWDLTVHKKNGYIVIDNDRPEEDYNPIDTITVSETSQEHLPTDDTVEEINKVKKLHEEAALINHIVSQQVFRSTTEAKVYCKKRGFPFDLTEDKEGTLEVPGRLYRYRKFFLDNEKSVELLVRTSVDGWESGKVLKRKELNMPNFVNVHCLNEWNSKYASGIFWNKYLEKQTSTILATEIRNNNFRMAKWIMNAKMADVANVKLAYVQREHIRDNTIHNIVHMETYNPDILAQTANLNTDNCWGVLKTIIDALLKESDGDFHIVKEPNKSEIYIYKEVGDESESESEEEVASESGSEADDEEEEEDGSEENSDEDSDGSGDDESSSGDESSDEDESKDGSGSDSGKASGKKTLTAMA